MEVDVQNPDDSDDGLLYETLIEEIALEGLDGITLQALFERMIDREGAKISRGESHTVISTIWSSILKDQRLRFYFLPTARPDLQIWNRNLHLDSRGKFEEPKNAPEDIYPYKCIEVFEEDDRKSREGIKKGKLKRDKKQNEPLPLDVINRISLSHQNDFKKNGEFNLEGIRFAIPSSSIVKNKNPVGHSKKKSKDESKQIEERSSKRLKSARISTEKKNQMTSSKKDVDDVEILHQKGKGNRKKVKAQKPSKTLPPDSSAKNNSAGSSKNTKNKDGAEDADFDNKSQDKIALVRGSCEHFETRKDVTKLIRAQKISYFRANKMFGNKLVVVASQFLREFFLFGHLNQVPITGPQYCMVERIGRGRHYGEPARGKVSLTCMKIDSKTLFYYRKSLLADNLITKQGLIVKFPENRTGALISVFHLPQFFRHVDSAESINIRKVFAFMCNSPNKTVEYFKLQHVFGKYLMKMISEEYRDFVEIEDEAYALMYPDEFENEGKAARRENMLKRKVRVIRLKNPEIRVRDIIQKQLASSAEEGDTPVNVQCKDDDEEEFDWNFCYFPNQELAHELEVTSLLRYMIERGSQGFLLGDLSDHFEITNLDSRSASRYLSRWKIVNTYQEDHERNKVTRYVYVKCDGHRKPNVDVENVIDGLIDGTTRSDSSSDKQIQSVIKNLPSEEDSETILSLPSISPIKPPPTATPKKKNTWKKLSFKVIPTKPVPPLGFTPIVLANTDGKDVMEISISKDVNAKSEEHIIPSTPSSMKMTCGKTYTPFTFAQQEEATTSGQLKTAVDEQRILENKTDPCVLIEQDKKFLPPPRQSKANPSPQIQLTSKQIQKREALEREKRKERRRLQLLRDGIWEDEADKMAHGLLKKQRVEWSPEEDRCVLYIFISSILFHPQYNLDKIFIFNPTQIRDVFHSTFPESRNKTSCAIRRRLHGLMKNPLFYAKYRSSLYAALSDEYLYTTYVEEHVPQPSIQVFHVIPTESLTRVFEYLKKKCDEKLLLVDSEIETENLSKNLGDLFDARELRRMEKIWVDIWGGVFKEMLRISKIVPPVRQIDKQLEAEGFVIDEANYTFSSKDLPSLTHQNLSYCTPIMPYSWMEENKEIKPPLAIKPVVLQEKSLYSDDELEYAYQVSQSLLQMANTNSSVENSSESDTEVEDEEEETEKDIDGDSSFKKRPKRNHSLSTEKASSVPMFLSHQKVKQTEQSSKVEQQLELRQITLQFQEFIGSRSDLSSCQRNAENESEVLMWTGRTAMLSVVLSGHTMKSVQSFMASIPDSHLETVFNSLRAVGMLSITRISRRVCLSSTMKRKLVNYTVPAAFRIANCLLDTCNENGSSSLLQFNHLGTVYLLSEIAPLLRLDIHLPTSIINIHEEWKNDYQTILESCSKKTADDKEKVALRLLRYRLNADIANGRFVEKDFFDINLPNIHVKPLDYSRISLENIVYQDEKPSLINQISYLENSLIQLVEYNQMAKLFGTSEKDICLGEFSWLYDVIKLTETTGISLKFLLTHFDRAELKNGLMYLIDCNYIYMVGIRHRKFVACSFMENWTANVPDMHGNLTKRVVMRPWIDAHGEMNWKLLDRAYVGILGIVQRNGMVMVDEICRQLSPIFSPVEVIILLSTLLHLKIVDVYKYNSIESKPFDLFFNTVDRDIEEEDWEDLEFPYKDYNVEPLLDMEIVWVETMPFHITKYAQLQQSFLPIPRPENPMSLVEEDLEDALMINEGCLNTHEPILDPLVPAASTEILGPDYEAQEVSDPEEDDEYEEEEEDEFED